MSIELHMERKRLYQIIYISTNNQEWYDKEIRQHIQIVEIL